MKPQSLSRALHALVLGILFFLGACAGTAESGTFVWIDVPIDDLHIPLQAVQIEGHATNPTGINRVEVWSNGELVSTLDGLPTDRGLAKFAYSWTPPGPGEYTIQAVAVGTDGVSSEPDSAHVHVGDEPAAVTRADVSITSVEALLAGEKAGIPFCNIRVVYTNAGDEAVPTNFTIQFSFDGTPRQTVTVAGGLPPGANTEVIFVYQFIEKHDIGINLDSGNVIAESNEANNAFAGARSCTAAPTGLTPTPTPAPTPTPTPVSETVIQFWADPVQIQAGACTKIKWHVENVRSIIFGEGEQPFDGSYKDCLCKNERYTLTINHLDGTQEKRSVDIEVKGVCPTIVPEEEIPPPVSEDKTPPPVPTLVVPANGLTTSCRASQNLAWIPVSDPSGIARYEVQVERQSGDNKWKAVSGSPFSVTNKTMNLPVECGWIYHWRVRAIDNKANVGAWSGWFQFTDTLE
jgi:hypothetical protein